MITKQTIIDNLKQINYPGFSRDIVSFGLIKDIIIKDDNLVLIIRVKTDNENQINQLSTDIKEKLFDTLDIKKIDIQIELDKVDSNFENNKIEGIKNIIAVGSAKGGVGKSTVSINLAVELSKEYKVGFLDLDIYGPSLPLMISETQTPEIINQKLIPIKKHGMQLMSFGFLNQGDSPAIWRGPMVAKLTNQFFDNVDWKDLDFLIIDLPPGTGDIQLTLAQKLSLDGIVIVTTPQKISLEDVRKGSEMFKKVNVPILGIVENMSALSFSGKFTSDNKDNSGNIIIKGVENPITVDKNGDFEIKLNIFEGPGGLSESERLDVPLLGSIPLDSALSMSVDAGTPFMLKHNNNNTAKEFIKITRNIKNRLE